MDWYKAYHGLPYDARLTVIARKASISKAEALAVWLALLDCASRNRPRGLVGDVDIEDIAIPLDIAPEDAARALAAFRDKGMITGQGHIRAWARHQPGSTLRVRTHRLRHAALHAETMQTTRTHAAQEEPPPVSVLAQAPPLPPDDPAETARRRLRLQRQRHANTRRPPDA